MTPELAALIAECDAVHAEVSALHASDHPFDVPRERARVLRTRIAGFRAAGLADVQAKAAMVGRLWDFPALREETAEMIGAGDIGLDALPLFIVRDLIEVGEGGPCA